MLWPQYFLSEIVNQSLHQHITMRMWCENICECYLKISHTVEIDDSNSSIRVRISSIFVQIGPICKETIINNEIMHSNEA